jgi:hypothetical protein
VPRRCRQIDDDDEADGAADGDVISEGDSSGGEEAITYANEWIQDDN